MGDVGPDATEATNDIEPEETRKSKDEASASFSVVDGFRIVFGLLLISGLLGYFITGNIFWNHNAWWTRPRAIIAKLRSPVILEEWQLAKYNGEDEALPIYLALNGTIYDVTANPRIYGPGGMYNIFAGRDAARGFVTGCFQEDANSDLRGVEWTFVPKDVEHWTEKSDEALSRQERLYRYEMVGKGLYEVDKAIGHWAKVFRGETGKDYFEVGHVKRNEGALDVLDMMPIKLLCESAERKRPKAQFDEAKTYKKDKRAEIVKKQELDSTKIRNAVPIEETESSSAGHDEL